MKAKDLMIGDWVAYTGGGEPKTRQVIEITSLNQVQLWDGNSWILVGEKYIAPLPIRGTILKTNSFEYDELDEQYSWQKGDNRTGISEEVTLVEDSDCWVATVFGPNCDIEIGEFKLRYVHELQHLLRIVGITKEIEEI